MESIYTYNVHICTYSILRKSMNHPFASPPLLCYSVIICYHMLSLNRILTMETFIQGMYGTECATISELDIGSS